MFSYKHGTIVDMHMDESTVYQVDGVDHQSQHRLPIQTVDIHEARNTARRAAGGNCPKKAGLAAGRVSRFLSSVSTCRMVWA